MIDSATHCACVERNPSINRNGYPRPICVRVSSNVQFVCGCPTERKKIPMKIKHSARQSVCIIMLALVCPRARRLTIEYGNATPTRKEKEGWIKSCSEQPAHSTWV